ncbi:hypothetical protein LP7551_04453 [Roseibium album]|nr:hypothetical protein LP7551_04453 [Roseibium album]
MREEDTYLRSELKILTEDETQFFKMAQFFVTAVALLVLTLSIFREFYLLTLGRETLLGNLKPFELDNEKNIGTWFSSVLIAYCALLTFRCCFDGHKRKDYYARRNWFLLGLVLLSMSMEEIVGFHERTTGPLRGLLNADGLLYFTWVVPGILVVFLVSLYFIPFVLRFPLKTTVGIVFSGAIYVTGAVGMELISGSIASGIGLENNYYIMVTIIEETLEILGFICFSWVIVDYMSASQFRKSPAT